MKYVWSEEKGNLVKITTLPAGHGMGLKKKFDETMQHYFQFHGGDRLVKIFTSRDLVLESIEIMIHSIKLFSHGYITK